MLYNVIQKLTQPWNRDLKEEKKVQNSQNHCDPQERVLRYSDQTEKKKIDKLEFYKKKALFYERHC